MGEFTTLMARDGHNFRAYLAAASGQPRGAIVVVQEIFGVNAHIRAVVEDFAAQGYVVIAPSLFDRVRRGVELGYSEKEVHEGRGYVAQLKWEQTLRDLSAAIAVVKHAGRVGMVGYCWGGRVTYVAACELPIACGIVYYGARIVEHLDKKPKCPVMYHFGEHDARIPLSEVEQIRAVHPEGIFHIYPAGHGFNCTERADYDSSSAALARERSLEFFTRHVAREDEDSPASGDAAPNEDIED